MGLGGSNLCRVRSICGFVHSQVATLGFLEKGVKIHRFGGVGALLAVDPRLAVETGPGGVGRHPN